MGPIRNGHARLVVRKNKNKREIFRSKHMKKIEKLKFIYANHIPQDRNYGKERMEGNIRSIRPMTSGQAR